MKFYIQTKFFEDYEITKSIFHFNASCRNVISGYSSLNENIPLWGFLPRMVDCNPVVCISWKMLLSVVQSERPITYLIYLEPPVVNHFAKKLTNSLETAPADLSKTSDNSLCQSLLPPTLSSLHTCQLPFRHIWSLARHSEIRGKTLYSCAEKHIYSKKKKLFICLFIT